MISFIKEKLIQFSNQVLRRTSSNQHLLRRLLHRKRVEVTLMIGVWLISKWMMIMVTSLMTIWMKMMK